MKILTEHDRVAIVTIAMLTSIDVSIVAEDYLKKMDRLENWLVNEYYKGAKENDKQVNG